MRLLRIDRSHDWALHTVHHSECHLAQGDQSLNTYVVLLHKMQSRTGKVVETTPLPQIPQNSDVQILDVFAVVGIFDAVLICRAPTNRSVAKLLNELDGWHTDALLATEHIRLERIFGTANAVTH